MNDQKEKIELAPVEKTIRVPIDVEAAFKLFTEGLTSWWPLKSHSVFEDEAVECFFEGRQGGRIYEVNGAGEQSDWGRVLVWAPPGKVVFNWHPGRDAKTEQRVEVRFTAEGEGTRVELTHGDWEVLGEIAGKTRAGYDTGWDLVLGEYVKRSGANE
ncbi:MAG: SRPBCC domain-containing protein [Anaerolineae bacterium]|nr:SRPBCC domain-containing protein [Anaerolineae bacterium]